jgi:diguanylate cyclase (GGDEF)-like protein
MLKNWSISAKLMGACGFLLLALVLIGANAVDITHRLGHDLWSLSRTHLSKQADVQKMADAALATNVGVFRYVAWASSEVNRETRQVLESELAGRDLRMLGQLDQFEQRSDISEEERVAAAKIRKSWQRYHTAVSDTVDIAEGDPALATLMLGGTDEDYNQVALDIQALASLANSAIIKASARLWSLAETSSMVMAAGVPFAIVLSLIVSLVVVRSVVGPIRNVTQAMLATARGADTPLALGERRDEVGQMVGAIEAFRDRTRRDTALLTAREQELRQQNLRFDAALSNMSQGLAMFDKNGRLIVCNDKYSEIYGEPAAATRPGIAHGEILRRRLAAGLYGMPNPATYVRERAQEHGADVDMLVPLADGRIVSLSQRQMDDGGWVSTHEDVTERQKAERQIAFMARHDALTGLPNRVEFRESMEEALVAAERGRDAAVLCLDLDHFKEVNDTLGHPIGDALLRQVAERLANCVREGDAIARLGGDEFAVVAQIDRAEEAARLAARIVDSLGRAYTTHGHDLIIGVSIGIALVPSDGENADELLKNADMALYRAKSEGRGTARFFEPEMDARMQARRRLEVDLRRAIAHGEFELYYQPIVAVSSGRISAFEALVRWNHPECGIVMPMEFVPLAEETAMISQIGEWVLRNACCEAATWADDIRVSVNLSPVQFRTGNLEALVMQSLGTSGLVPNRLELEITESVLLQNTEATRRILDNLHGLGVRIALDDFGTGYSSLSYLRSFPFDKIKIDKSFVESIVNPEAGAIVKAVVDLGDVLGICTTAEGVETAEQLEELRAKGCKEAQGYLFSMPRPASELADLIGAIAQRAA